MSLIKLTQYSTVQTKMHSVGLLLVLLLSPTLQVQAQSEAVFNLSGSAFNCQPLSDSDGSPASVHQLRPTDVRVIGAMGNSLTAGFGVLLDAAEIYVNRTDFRGLSWSIGGDSSLPYVTTLPNILRQYIPDLYGYSTGETPDVDYIDLTNTRLNVARSGALTSEMLGQAKVLVRKMHQSKNIDFDNDWKLVTMFIGTNDLCQLPCSETPSSPDVWTRNVGTALDYLRDNLPRTFVNLVQVDNVGDILRAAVLNNTALGVQCRFFTSLCTCGPFGPNSTGDIFDRLTRDYQQGLEDLIRSGRYDNSDDFTVVLQPFLSTMKFLVVDGEVDLYLLASDCLHLSPAGNRALAIGLWNNMFERVGQKTSIFVPPVTDITCPTDEEPFLFTAQNSSSVGSSSPLNSVLLLIPATLFQLVVEAIVT